MDDPNNEKAQHDPLAGCFLRLFWMIVGHALLVFLRRLDCQRESQLS